MCPRGRPRGQGRPRGLHLWSSLFLKFLPSPPFEILRTLVKKTLRSSSQATTQVLLPVRTDVIP